ELFEYAALETRSGWQRLWGVTVPLLRPYLALAVFLSFTTAFADLATSGCSRAAAVSTPSSGPTPTGSASGTGGSRRRRRTRSRSCPSSSSPSGRSSGGSIPRRRSRREPTPRTLAARGPPGAGRAVQRLPHLLHHRPVAEDTGGRRLRQPALHRPSDLRELRGAVPGRAGPRARVRHRAARGISPLDAELRRGAGGGARPHPAGRRPRRLRAGSVPAARVAMVAPPPVRELRGPPHDPL